MRLNHDCVRAVLLFLEENLGYTRGMDFEEIKLNGFTDDDVIYSLIKLKQANYISGDVIIEPDLEDVDGCVTGITWEGHNFLTQSGITRFG